MVSLRKFVKVERAKIENAARSFLKVSSFCHKSVINILSYCCHIRHYVSGFLFCARSHRLWKDGGHFRSRGCWFCWHIEALCLH